MEVNGKPFATPATVSLILVSVKLSKLAYQLLTNTAATEVPLLITQMEVTQQTRDSYMIVPVTMIYPFHVPSWESVLSQIQETNLHILNV